MKTLHLTLKREPFDVMVSGEKGFEFRKPSKWIESRLFNPDGTRKEYDVVKAVNGYGGDKPYFIAEYKGFFRSICDSEVKYSNGLTVVVKKKDYILTLGDIKETGNLK